MTQLRRSHYRFKGVLSQRVIDREILKLRPLSESARAILGLLGNPDHSLQDLIAIIECDGPLTIRVLNIANSAIYGLPTKIQALSHAIVYLGEKEVIAIALSFSAAELFGEDPSGFTAGLWESAVQTALAARRIADSETRIVEPACAFTGGLIRDVGQSVLWGLLKGGASDLEACISTGRASDVCSAERELTGTDHCEVGARIGERFDLAPSFVALIRDHHKPERAVPEVQCLVDVVNVAEAVIQGMRIQEENAEFKILLDERCAARIGFSMVDLGELCAVLDGEFKLSRALISTRG